MVKMRKLIEINATEVVEQTARSRKERRETIRRLLNEAEAEYYRCRRERGELDEEPFEKAPEDFNPRDYIPVTGNRND